MSLPSTGNHYTASQTLGASDIDKWISFRVTSGTCDISLSGAIGDEGDQMILALRTYGNNLVRAKWVSGTLKVYSAEGIDTLTAAGTQDLIPNGGNRAILYTATKTGASEWTIREGNWWGQES